MAEIGEVFIDGASDIGLEAGVIRLDLVGLSANKQDEEQRSVLEFRQRVVMPLEGFINLYTKMQWLMDKLVEDGVVNKSDKTMADVEDGNRAGSSKAESQIFK